MESCDSAVAEFQSVNPATGQTIWSGSCATEADVDRAVQSARRAFDTWSDSSLDDRIALVRAFGQQLTKHKERLAETIAKETGKPYWESLIEVDSMIGKIDLSIGAYQQRCASVERKTTIGIAAVRYKPHGVVAVFGPFNLPGHLPNGHIVPALLAGNTVVFKPSEKTPLVAERTVELWQQAQLPPGVIELVQGDKNTGIYLAKHGFLDGVYFTGSRAAGLALARNLAPYPERILALEMGGNNPLIVFEVSDLSAAAYTTVQSAFITSGQRCTCARRLIVPRGPSGDAFIERLVDMIRSIRVGPYTQNPPPFMGPVIDDEAAEKVLSAQSHFIDRGAQPLIACSPEDRISMLRPGLLDVTDVPDRPDKEVFGPLLTIIRVKDFSEAIDQANATAYGLVGGLLSDDRKLYDRFYCHVRAGLINWNCPTTGASGRLPFGGVGQSGNHRPAGYYAADYCAYPVASIELETLALPAQPSLGLTA